METRVDARTERFFTLSLDMLCVARFDGRFVDLNPVWERTLGWTVEELKRRPFIDFVHPDDRAATVGASLRLQGGAELVSFENRYRCKDGSYRWLLWSATASAEESLYYAVARDITDRRRLEDELRADKVEADRANKAKSDFLSRLSHELRTPITSVLGFSQLLEMGTLDETGRGQALQQIRKAGRHLLDLVNEVLDMARVESGRLTLSMEPVKVADAVCDAEDLVQPLADERGITLRMAGIEQTGELSVIADRQRLQQVLLNLLANAIKYCGGGCNVTVSAELRPRKRLRLAVTDNGPGIPEELRGRLFTPFERLGEDSRPENGSGVGLALSKRLVEAMEGAIGYEHAPENGSTFWVDLRLAEHRTLKAHGALPAAAEAAGTRASID
jgi:PAS domain S-box-containing protein